MNRVQFGKVNISAVLPALERVIWITPSTYQCRSEVVVYTNTLEYLRDHPDGADLATVQYLLDREIAVGFIPVASVTTDDRVFEGNDLRSKLELADVTVYSKSYAVQGLHYYFSQINGRNLLTIKNKRLTERFFINEIGGEVGYVDDIRMIPVDMINQESNMIMLEGDMEKFIGTSGNLVPPVFNTQDDAIVTNPNLHNTPTFFTAYNTASTFRDIDLETIPVEWYPDFIVIGNPAGGCYVDDYELGKFYQGLNDLAEATHSQVITVENKEDMFRDVQYEDHWYWHWDLSNWSWTRFTIDIIDEMGFKDWLHDRCGFDYGLADQAVETLKSGNEDIDMASKWADKEQAQQGMLEMLTRFDSDLGQGTYTMSGTWSRKNIPEPTGYDRVYHYEYSNLARPVTDTSLSQCDYLNRNSFSVANDLVIAQGAKLPVWVLYVNMLYNGYFMQHLNTEYRFKGLTREELRDSLDVEDNYTPNMNTVSKDGLGLLLDMPWMQNKSYGFETFIQDFVLGLISRACLRNDITRDNLSGVLDIAEGLVKSMNWTESCTYAYDIEENTAHVKFKTVVKYLMNKTITITSDVTLVIK